MRYKCSARGKDRRDTLYDFSSFVTADQPVLHLVRISLCPLYIYIFIRRIRVLMICPGSLSISHIAKFKDRFSRKTVNNRTFKIGSLTVL